MPRGVLNKITRRLVSPLLAFVERRACSRTSVSSTCRPCDLLAAMLSGATIEPIVFFNFLALSFFHVSQHAVLYRSVCMQNYARYDDTINCDALHNSDPALEDRIQKDASNWNMVLSLCYLLPAVASDIFLGAWSDKHGRKVSILVGLTGLIVASVAFICSAVFPMMSLYVLCVAKVFIGVTGYVAIVMISSWAYLTDVVQDKKQLTSRMMLVQVFRYVADVVGSFSLSTILRYSNLAVTLLMAQIFFTIAFFYALAKIHQLPPADLKRLSSLPNMQTPLGSVDATLNKQSRKYYVFENENEWPLDRGGDDQQESRTAARPVAPLKTESTFRYILRLYHDVWVTLTRPRMNNERAYLLCCTVIYFFFMMSEIGLQGSILSLYVFHRPFYWSPSTLGAYKGLQHVCSLTVNVIGALVYKFFHPSDTAVMLVALGCGMFHLTLIGLADNAILMVAAAVMGGFSTLLVPALKSFMVRIVGEHEVGKTLAANGTAADLAFVSSALIFTNIYTYTVATNAGIVFFVGGGFIAFCCAITVWMHCDRRCLHETVSQ